MNTMVNPELHMLHDTDGLPVCNVSFDLSADQIASAAHVVEDVRLERHRHQALSTDDVLALRELTGLSDELHGLAEQHAHASLLLTLARFTALHDALGDWIHAADERGWMREEDREHYTRADALLDPMAQLRADALQAVLGQSAPHTPGA
ncbi:MAG TPA: hypothetical protein VM684_14745 [Gaiellales bacterium]|nr:hypothetical protein [Gaiellales bacterium]